MAKTKTIVFAVTVMGHDFENDLSEAATWLEGHLGASQFHSEVTAYASAADAAADEKECAGHWEATPVIFRKWQEKDGGDVIALFPTEPGTNEPHTCSSYAHVGQHGSADPTGIMHRTRPATPEEYADLKNELEGAPYGYRFKIVSKLNGSFVQERFKKLSKS